MRKRIFKIIISMSITFLQILLSEIVFKIVFGCYVLFETSGSAGTDVILFFTELYMGVLFLLTNLSILCDSRVINIILLFGLCGLFIPAGFCLLILLGYVPGYAIGTFATYKINERLKAVSTRNERSINAL